MDPTVKDFLNFNYAEAKDLAKSFLTLIAAILVFSITFSEKVVVFQTAGVIRRILLIISWSFFVLAIIGCGVAIVAYFNTLLYAVHCQSSPCMTMINGVNYENLYVRIFDVGNSIMLVAGASFAVGLFSLVGSALLSLWSNPGQPGHESTDPSLERLVVEPPTDSSAHGSEFAGGSDSTTLQPEK
jgi:hypothetical protein